MLGASFLHKEITFALAGFFAGQCAPPFLATGWLQRASGTNASGIRQAPGAAGEAAAVGPLAGVFAAGSKELSRGYTRLPTLSDSEENEKARFPTGLFM